MKRKTWFLIILLILLGTGLFFSYKAYENYSRQVKNSRVLLDKKKQGWMNLRNALKNKALNFKGKVCIVIKDLDRGWEIDFNKDKLVPSASLVKVPIMLSCFYAAQNGRISLKDTISLKALDKVGGSEILRNKPAGSVFTVEELFKPMITQSDNSAANLLIDFLGFDTLNAFFKKIGLKNTNIARKMMDFEERREGKENYTTAEDMAYLLGTLYYKTFLNKDISERCLALLKQQKINDRIPREIPYAGRSIAHKTGLEKYVCHDIGIVFTQKGDFLICVLVKHEDKHARQAKRLISEIALLTYNYYQGP